MVSIRQVSIVFSIISLIICSVVLYGIYKDSSRVDSYSETSYEQGASVDDAGAEFYNPDRENLSVPNFKEECDMSYLLGDRDTVERVVMMESGNQCYEGKMAVAQCIRNTAEKKGITASEVVLVKNQYASTYKGEVSWEVKEAVSDVFDRGLNAVDDPIMYFYSTVGGFYSNWHENSLEYTCTIQDHKFFKEREIQ